MSTTTDPRAPHAPTSGAAWAEHPGFDHRALFNIAMHRIRTLAGSTWTDHNAHDPGITILELLCYALTDLAYRANYPMEDLLAPAPASQGLSTINSFVLLPDQALPTRPWTELDLRRFMIDIPGVRNAWVVPHQQVLFADPPAGRLASRGVSGQTDVPVPLRGIHDVVVDTEASVKTAAARRRVLAEVRSGLNAVRNLGEDFADVRIVQEERFLFCATLVVPAEVDIDAVAARVLAIVSEYLDPPIRFRSMSEASADHEGGRPPIERLFDGPRLDSGFLSAEELRRAQLRTEIRLSDVIAAIMDDPDVQALPTARVVHAAATPANDRKLKWVLKVTPGKKAVLDAIHSKLAFERRGVRVSPDQSRIAELFREATTPRPGRDKLEAPRGRHRAIGEYSSVQSHFPLIYGLGDHGPDPRAGTEGRVPAQQLKGYLLHFDQILADSLALLEEGKRLFSTDPKLTETYFHPFVKTFPGQPNIYVSTEANAVFKNGANKVDGYEDSQLARRNRFLDHLIARTGEAFHEIRRASPEDAAPNPTALIKAKCAFLDAQPDLAENRAGAFNCDLGGDVWGTDNVGGYVRRVAALLGIEDLSRRDLSNQDKEGLFVFESILLRPRLLSDSHLSTCKSTNREPCPGTDPYSFRIHIILPGYAGRFLERTFRDHAESVLREELPAHLSARICWVSREDMRPLEQAYRAWLESGITTRTPARKTALRKLIEALGRVRNVHKPGQLRGDLAATGPDTFLLGRSSLGTQKKP